MDNLRKNQDEDASKYTNSEPNQHTQDDPNSPDHQANSDNFSAFNKMMRAQTLRKNNSNKPEEAQPNDLVDYYLIYKGA